MSRLALPLALAATLLAFAACDSSVDVVPRKPGSGTGGGDPTTATTSQGGTGAAGGMGGAGGEECEGGLGTECEPNRKGLLFDGAAAARTIAIDSAGNVVVGGRFSELELDGSVLTSVGEQDLFVAKLDGVTGAVIWSRSFGSIETEQRIDLALDEDDNVILVAGAQAPIDFGGGVVCDLGFGQMVVAKLDTMGQHVFSRCFGDPVTTTGGVGLNVATTAGGAIVVTGYSEDDVDVGSGLLPYWEGVMFVAAYAPDGQGLWSRKYGLSDAPNAHTRALAVDDAGNIAIVVSFHGALDFDGIDAASDDDGDGLLVKLDAAGELLWGATMQGYFVHSDVAFGPSGEIVVGAEDIERVVSALRDVAVDGTVAAFDAEGSLRWVADPTSQPRSVESVGVDSAGNVLAISRLSPGQQPAGRDLGFAAFSPDGGQLFERHFGSGGAADLAVRGNKVAFCGSAGNDPGLDFGDGLLVSNAKYGAGVFAAWFEPWQSAAPMP